MSLNHQDLPSESTGQSPGCDPKTTKRNSGLFAFLKWFKPSTSRESIDTQNSSSSDSLNSTHSSGTVASFSYLPPSAYSNQVSEKSIVPGPETDTYRARLKQRDKRRENDKNLTLRKKYNLFFHRETLLKSIKNEEENSKSLPLMTRTTMEEEEKLHRRTNSESSKTKKAGAYLHVKGKRKAPQPPGLSHQQSSSTMSLRRKKRLAPPPPSLEKIKNTLEYADTDIIFNDSLKLDHGILKPAKEANPEDANASARSSYVAEAPVSPRPWYKRNTSRENNSKKDGHKYEPIERLPEVQFVRNSTIDLTLDDVLKTDKKKEEKRKSGMSFLTNISELDREASEIIKKEHEKNGNELQEIPQFMRPKDEPKINTDSWVSPKRRSAKDLIAKFNAITNVTKATVFGVSQSSRKDYFGKRTSMLNDDRKQESMLESHKKRIEQIDRKLNNPLMKSESASAIKPKPETPKIERKNWNCPKCFIENDYWRIICHVCSTIKPYFDDFSSNSSTKINEEPASNKPPPEKIFERAKTQIGFSALVSYNLNNKKKIEKSVSLDEKTSNKGVDNKNEEREKLKKMLIEMKNSLPKRKSNILMKQNSRTSIIVENPTDEENKEEVKEKPEVEKEKKKPEVTQQQKTQEEKVLEIIIGTSETIYENIKVKKTDNPKPIKVSASAQTSSVVKKLTPLKNEKKNNFELMRPKDFENIYSDNNGQSAARIYANLARNDELSLFFNMPKRFTDLKNSLSQNENNTDTIEINRLLRRLESSIAKGELAEAAIYAKELAHLKVNCSVIRQKPPSEEKKKQGFSIEMYVEDKISHRGPFTIEVSENQTVGELKLQVQQEFEIPANVQRWILGKELATDDKATLKEHNITTERCPVFLYLVAPDSKTTVETKSTDKDQEKPSTSGVKEQSPKSNIHIPKIINVIPKTAEAPPKEENAIQKSSISVSAKPEITNVKKTTHIDDKLQSKKTQPKTIVNISITEIEPAQKTKVVNLVQKQTQKPEVTVTKVDNFTKKEPEEDLEDDDTKTLKPQSKEWECHLCTLLNPLSSNICAVCATVRQKETQVPEPTKKTLKKKAPQPQTASGATASQADQTYLQLVNLDNKDLVETREPFECIVCFTEVPLGQGVTLRECLHQFCKLCLAHTVEYTEDAEVKCPFRDDQYSCNIALQDREIKALVTPHVYESYLAKSVTEAENKIGKSFHCKTPDCKGWCIFEDNVNEFRCPVCRRVNCLTCQAIHTGMNCKQYQEKMNQESEIDVDARRTKEMVDEMVKKGEALTCPTCQVILMKKWGCDWVRCSMCKTEICWVTRGPRWGPAGKGDTSGGCQCGVNGVKCHPQCSYCH